MLPLFCIVGHGDGFLFEKYTIVNGVLVIKLIILKNENIVSIEFVDKTPKQVMTVERKMRFGEALGILIDINAEMLKLNTQMQLVFQSNFFQWVSSALCSNPHNIFSVGEGNKFFSQLFCVILGFV